MLDKSKIKKAFSKSAKTYDSYSTLQKEINNNLVNRLLAHTNQPKRILDIGTGTGNCAFLLSEHFPSSKVYVFDIADGMTDFMSAKMRKLHKKIYVLTADALHMPYVDNTFDLAVSNLTYQWIEDIGKAFKEVKRIIGSRGIFAFTTLSSNTFKELRESYNHGNIEKHALPPLHKFITREDLDHWLRYNDFLYKTIDIVTIKKNYPDVKTFLKTLKYIGAQNAHSDCALNSINKKTSLLNLVNFYESRFCNDSGIYATYEILLVIASV